MHDRLIGAVPNVPVVGSDKGSYVKTMLESATADRPSVAS
jgi:hypothetical protein